MPPDFLKGSCDAHPANSLKRHRLYKQFWRLLKEIGFFKDPDYLRQKERKTVRVDKREILPKCIVKVKNTMLGLDLIMYIHVLIKMNDLPTGSTNKISL